MKIFLIVVVVIVSFFIIRFTLLGSKSRSMQVSLGVQENGKLLECKSTKNCVLGSLTSEDNMIIKVSEILKNEGLEIIAQDEKYIHALAKSSLFGFIDDVEFHYHEEEKKLYYRSSSRVGNSDLGANSKRINSLLPLIQE